MTSTFEGLTSRWTSPSRWATSRASADLLDDLDGASRGERPVPTDQDVQSVPGDEGHLDVEPTVDVAVVVDRDDVRGVQARGQRGLSTEPVGVLGVGAQPGAQDLERDLAVLAGVDRAPDLSHPAPAEQCSEPVGAELFHVPAALHRLRPLPASSRSLLEIVTRRRHPVEGR